VACCEVVYPGLAWWQVVFWIKFCAIYILHIANNHLLKLFFDKLTLFFSRKRRSVLNDAGLIDCQWL